MKENTVTQYDIRCVYCNKPIHIDITKQFTSDTVQENWAVINGRVQFFNPYTAYHLRCSSCNKLQYVTRTSMEIDELVLHEGG